MPFWNKDRETSDQGELGKLRQSLQEKRQTLENLRAAYTALVDSGANISSKELAAAHQRLKDAEDMVSLYETQISDLEDRMGS